MLKLLKQHAEPLFQCNLKGYCSAWQVPNGLKPLVLIVNLKKKVYSSPIKRAAQNPSSWLSGWLSLNLGVIILRLGNMIMYSLCFGMCYSCDRHHLKYTGFCSFEHLKKTLLYFDLSSWLQEWDRQKEGRNGAVKMMLLEASTFRAVQVFVEFRWISIAPGCDFFF